VYADGISVVMLGNSRECDLPFYAPENLATTVHDAIAAPANYPQTYPTGAPPTPSPGTPYFIPPSNNFPCVATSQ
jgi:hypothetical protein